jgi:SHS family sialic acid transporter-like MFS transporter
MTSDPAPHTPTISDRGRYLILAAAFLGWLFSGTQMSLMTLAARSATQEFAARGYLETKEYLSWQNLFVTSWKPERAEQALSLQSESGQELLRRQNPKWFSLYNAAFLLGAAFGGFAFGWLGDRIGRVKGMGASILCFSLFGGAGYFVLTAEQLLTLRFLAGMGVGGMWPTGVSLAAEAWSDVSRPKLSGWLGASANFGIMIVNAIACFVAVQDNSWRWIMLVAAIPAFLVVLFVGLAVPESPAWLAAQTGRSDKQTAAAQTSLFRPPLLRLTLIGIALGTIPLLGGWGVTQWFIPWTEQVAGKLNPQAKAWTALMRSGGGALGSWFGGQLASWFGRRTTYFVISVASLVLSECIYVFLDPKMAIFSIAVFIAGAVTTTFFGWLPLYLPELFPTHARAMGAGISFNFGRVLTALGVVGTGALTAYFHEDYRQAGSIMSLVYALGIVVILFAPDTSKKKLSEG